MSNGIPHMTCMGSYVIGLLSKVNPTLIKFYLKALLRGVQKHGHFGILHFFAT